MILIQSLQVSFTLYSDWRCEQTIKGHQMIIGLKPAIDAALEQQKTEQKNKSYDKNQLSNLASKLADRVFPQEVITNSIPMRRIGTDKHTSKSHF